jgi:hypothetical protein
MTPNELQRAATVFFAARECGPGASADTMKMIACVVRNRVRAGWGDGYWLNVIENHDQSSAHDPLPAMPLDLQSRNLQILARDIDEIFYSQSFDLAAHPTEIPEDPAARVGKALYWLFMDRPVRQWFQDRIIRDQKNHPPRTQFGTLMLFD